jgi:hypothetical protein
MPWEDEQDRLTQEARLNVASPEEVLRELKRITQKPRFGVFAWDGAFMALAKWYHAGLPFITAHKE